MGSIFRKTTCRPVPAGAVVTRDRTGNETAKWTPRRATRSVTAPVKTLADGRKVIETTTGAFYAKYRDSDGFVRTVSTGCRDEANARQRLADLERRAERVKSGVMSRREAHAVDRLHEPLHQHIGEYVDRLPGRRGGLASPVHRDNTRRYLERLAAECRWACLADLSRADLERWIADQSRPGPDGKPVRSARSINCHRAAAVAFANWLADPNIGRLPSNPFGTGRSAAAKADEDSDPRRPRRALSPDELSRLVDAARNAPRRRPQPPTEGEGGRPRRPAERLSGNDRGDLWLILAGTGLRVGEIEQLTVADIRLDAVPPHVRIPAAVAKARREQTVPLRSDLVAMLRDRLAGRSPSDPVFAIPRALIARFNADCRRAGISKRNDDGLTVDVHSLRKTFATMLSVSGVAPRITMELMRHSRIELTMSVYTDPRLLPLAAAVESTLPSVVAKVVATGDASRHSVASGGTAVHQSKAAPSVA